MKFRTTLLLAFSTAAFLVYSLHKVASECGVYEIAQQ